MRTHHTLAAAAAAAGISAATMTRRLRDGTGPRTERFNGMRLVPNDALAEWIASGQHRDGRRRRAA